MCLEQKTLAVPVGDDKDKDKPKDDPNAQVVTVDGKPPILRVDDPRLDSSEKGMQRRRKLLAVLGKEFPMALEYTEVTTRKIVAPYEQGPFKDTMWWARAKPNERQQNTCAPVNTHVLSLAKASGNWGFGIEGQATKETNWKVPPSKRQSGFVKYRPGILPSVGDCFLLYEGTMAGHCGVVCQASLVPDEFWITCDGGQPDRTGELHKTKAGYFSRSYNKPDPDYEPDKTADLVAREAGYLVPRRLNCKDPNNPLISNFFTGGGGETLYGWRNLTADGVYMQNEEFDAAGTEADYQSLKKRILRVDEMAKEELWRRRHWITAEL